MRRSTDARVLAGICGGISQATGIDVTLLRIGFVLVGLFAGFPVLIYALAWLIVPLDDETTNIFSRAINDRRGIRLVIAVIPSSSSRRSSSRCSTSASSGSSAGRSSWPPG